MTGGGSSLPEVRALLGALVASKPAGHIAEIGTAFGEGALAIVDAMSADATFVTVEPDRERYLQARAALAGTPAQLVHGRWEDVLPERGPFDVIFFDGGTGAASLALAVGLLAPGGIIVKDDLTPGQPIAGDAMREALLLDARLIATEVLTTPSMAVIVAVCR